MIDTVEYKFKSTGTFYFRYSATNISCPGTYIDTIIITNATLLNLSTSASTTICKGDSILLTTIPLNGSYPYKFRWYSNGLLLDTLQNYTVKPLLGARYIIEVRSSDTCNINKKDTINITVDTLALKLKSIKDTSICAGTIIDIIPSIISGTPPFQYKWYLAGTLLSTTPTLFFKPGVSADYFLRVSSANNCSNIYHDTFRISLDTSELIVAINDTVVCRGSTINLISKIIKGKPPLQFSWYENGTLISNSSSLTVSPNATANYVLKIISADNCINSFTKTIQVKVDSPEFKVAKIRDTIICGGDVLKINPVIELGKAPFQYRWYRNGILISNAADFSFRPQMSSHYIVLITSSDYCFNSFSQTFHVDIFPLKQISISTNSISINYGQSAILRANALQGMKF